MYTAGGGVMAAATPAFADLSYGFDANNLYLKVGLDPDFTLPAGQSFIEFYLGAPAGGELSAFSQSGELLGFAANRLLELKFSGGVLGGVIAYQATADGWGLVATGPATDGRAAVDFPEEVSAGVAVGEDGQIEIAIPLKVLGNADVGASLIMRALYGEIVSGERTVIERLPSTGPAEVAVPDSGTTVAFLEVVDPAGDDTGPGTYSYPTDAVFKPGNFDITNFQVGTDEQNVVFRFTMRGPVDNPWDGPNGLSLQTFDIYIDTATGGDGGDTGGAAFLPGRIRPAAQGTAWDYAITVEGWESKIFTPGEEGPTEIAGPADFQVVTDPGQQKVTIRVPKSILGDNPDVALRGDGHEPGGISQRRRAARPRCGPQRRAMAHRRRAGRRDQCHARARSVWPEAGQQEAWLSDFPHSSAPQGEATAADFATVEFLTPGP